MRHFATTHGMEPQLCHPATTHWGRDKGGIGWGGVWVKGGDRLKGRLTGMWVRQGQIERLWIVLHVVLERHACGDQQNGFSPISTTILAKMIGRDFACAALAKLREIGFLDCDGTYCPKRKAKGYRFTPEIAALEAQWHPLSDALSSRISRWQEDRSMFAVNAHPSHRILWDSLQTLSLHPLAKGKMPSVAGGTESQLKRDAWQQSAHAVESRRWHFSYDPKSGRVFNNLTSLPKVMRSYALLNDQPCAEIDIRNSQPFFLAGLYTDRCAEALRYVEVVASGRFYEALNEASGVPYDPNDRDALKEATYVQVLFGRRYQSSPLWSGFVKLFPRLSGIIAESKARDHRLLPIELQRLEASAMIGKVVPRLAVEFPHTPFLTVHDSLVVPCALAEQAAEILKEVIREETGRIPSLRITRPASWLDTACCF